MAQYCAITYTLNKSLDPKKFVHAKLLMPHASNFNLIMSAKINRMLQLHSPRCN